MPIRVLSPKSSFRIKSKVLYSEDPEFFGGGDLKKNC